MSGILILYILETLFTVYTFMLLIRVIGSWIPSLSHSRFMQFIAFYTDPYLRLFQKIIPPLGMIDISPMIAFIGLQFIKYLIFSFIR